jgi:hypothetical protein
VVAWCVSQLVETPDGLTGAQTTPHSIFVVAIIDVAVGCPPASINDIATEIRVARCHTLIAGAPEDHLLPTLVRRSLTDPPPPPRGSEGLLQAVPDMVRQINYKSARWRWP